MLAAGGTGWLTLIVDGQEIAAGEAPAADDPVRAMTRPGEVRAAHELIAGIAIDVTVTLRAADWDLPPLALRLGIVPEPDEEAMLAAAQAAAATAAAVIVVVGTAPGGEAEGTDRPTLALPGRQDELVSRVAAVCDRVIVVVNAGMPVLAPWADQVAAVGYAWLPGQAFGDALTDVLLGRTEPGGRLPVTIPRAEADCPVLHATQTRMAHSVTTRGCWSVTGATIRSAPNRTSRSATGLATQPGATSRRLLFRPPTARSRSRLP